MHALNALLILLFFCLFFTFYRKAINPHESQEKPCYHSFRGGYFLNYNTNFYKNVFLFVGEMTLKSSFNFIADCHKNEQT